MVVLYIPTTSRTQKVVAVVGLFSFSKTKTVVCHLCHCSQLNNGYNMYIYRERGSSNFRFSDTTHMKVSINGEFPNHTYLMFFFHKPFQFGVPTRPQRPPIWSPCHLSFPTTISGATDPVPATAMPKGSALRRTRRGGTRPTRPARRAPRARITPCVEPVSEINVCT